jgi:uncharacterized protein (DUF1697 family)
MPELRELLDEAGFSGVRTYVQSGNVVLSSSLSAAELEQEAARLIDERFGFSVPVVVRTRDELTAVIERNPFGQVATNPKRYQVTFLSCALDPSVASSISALQVAPEQVAVVNREIYTWHPDGIARSKLWAKLSSERFLGVTGTARNWSTVTTLLSMADDG